MASSETARYEVTYTCGDTDSATRMWNIGAIRRCSHCDRQRQIVMVRDSVTGEEYSATAPQPAATVVQDTAYGYASAYGYVAQTVDYAAAELAALLNRHRSEVFSITRTELLSLHAMLLRGKQNASDALRRYDARIEQLDAGQQHD